MEKHTGVWRMLKLVNQVLRFQMSQCVALYVENILGGKWIKHI